MAKNDTQFIESAIDNKRTYLYYVDRLTELATSMFEWKNLPETVDVRYLERQLFYQGNVVFFKDEVIGFLALKSGFSSNLNVYGIPTKRYAIGENGYKSDELTDENSVIVWNNYLHTNTAPIIEMFAKRLYELDRTIDVNVKAQKTPVFIQCEEQQRLTMLNLYKKYDGNEPYIFGDKSLNPNALKVLKTEAPYVADKIYQLRTQMWNEYLTFLGISNTNMTKKERLISDEVIRNMGSVIASRYSRLDSRRKACETINKMFGLDISVDFKEDYREADDEVMIVGDTGEGTARTMVTDLRTRTAKI